MTGLENRILGQGYQDRVPGQNTGIGYQDKDTRTEYWDRLPGQGYQERILG